MPHGPAGWRTWEQPVSLGIAHGTRGLEAVRLLNRYDCSLYCSIATASYSSAIAGPGGAHNAL